MGQRFSVLRFKNANPLPGRGKVCIFAAGITGFSNIFPLDREI